MNSVVSSAVPPGLPGTTEPPCPRDESRGYSHGPLRGQRSMSGVSWYEITAEAVMMRQTILRCTTKHGLIPVQSDTGLSGLSALDLRWADSPLRAGTTARTDSRLHMSSAGRLVRHEGRTIHQDKTKSIFPHLRAGRTPFFASLPSARFANNQPASTRGPQPCSACTRW